MMHYLHAKSFNVLFNSLLAEALTAAAFCRWTNHIHNDCIGLLQTEFCQAVVNSGLTSRTGPSKQTVILNWM